VGDSFPAAVGLHAPATIFVRRARWAGLPALGADAASGSFARELSLSSIEPAGEEKKTVGVRLRQIATAAVNSAAHLVSRVHVQYWRSPSIESEGNIIAWAANSAWSVGSTYALTIGSINLNLRRNEDARS
jgi:hypothetical protein